MSSPSLTLRQYLTLHKYQGVGNDFLVVLDEADAEQVDATVARAVCDRHRGIGADGLIVTARRGEEFSFRLWNADGSGAEMSGNGIRCAAHALVDSGQVAGWPDPVVALSFRTPAGRRTVTARRGPDPSTIWASVDMGTVTILGDTARCNIGHGQLELDVGNPHLVVLGPDPAGVDVIGLGATLDAAVPGGRNVEFVTLGPGPDEVTMRVWERGVGETLACGTGSCAAAAAMRHWGRTGSAVTVHQPGGAVSVVLGDDGSAVLNGPSQRIARCQVSWADLAPRADLLVDR
jgi:diaminopimelate epimerase